MQLEKMFADAGGLLVVGTDPTGSAASSPATRTSARWSSSYKAASHRSTP
jgi:hypothetical protein